MDKTVEEFFKIFHGCLKKLRLKLLAAIVRTFSNSSLLSTHFLYVRSTEIHFKSFHFLHQPQSSVCQAFFLNLLRSNHIKVWPQAMPVSDGLDFRCRQQINAGHKENRFQIWPHLRQSLTDKEQLGNKQKII